MPDPRAAVRPLWVWLAVGAVMGWLIGRWVGAGLAGLSAACVWVIARRRRVGRRSAVLQDQLADAVRSITAGLRAGLSLAQSIRYAEAEAAPALAPSFEKLVNMMDTGDSLETALDRWAADLASDDARFVVGVLHLHRRSGGDLPRVLDQVAATLRDRRADQREIRALTAQARLSGAILGLLPIGFFLFLWFTSRGEIEGALRTQAGLTAVITGLVLEAVAFVWIRRLLEVT